MSLNITEFVAVIIGKTLAFAEHSKSDEEVEEFCLNIMKDPDVQDAFKKVAVTK